MSSIRSRVRLALVGFGFATALGIVLFAYRYLDEVARGHYGPVGHKLIEEMSSAYGLLLLLPALAWWTRRLRRAGLPWAQWLLAHLPGLLLFSLLHTTWNALVRTAAFPLFDLGRYDYGALPARYAMEFSIHLILYPMLVAAVTLLDARRDAREREARLARVEGELASARVRALESRLHPHFLFNALNTVSSVMYEDPAAADTMLTRLSDLLRRTLREEKPEVALREELSTLELWLAVMRARFGDRLVMTVDVPDELGAACVPPLLLQPLLENAVKHGAPQHGGAVTRIWVVAGRHDGALMLEVRDNGPGLAANGEEAFGRGVGLSTTRQRLTTLYGERGTIALDHAPEGGLRVRVSIPWREASSDA